MKQQLVLASLLAIGIGALTACEKEPERTALGDRIEAQRLFDRADGNKDGVVTVNEASGVPGLDFAAGDTDKNAALTPEEFEVAHVAALPPLPHS